MFSQVSSLRQQTDDLHFIPWVHLLVLGAHVKFYAQYKTILPNIFVPKPKYQWKLCSLIYKSHEM